jgi:hypothetical protein
MENVLHWGKKGSKKLLECFVVILVRDYGDLEFYSHLYLLSSPSRHREELKFSVPFAAK